MQLTRQNLLKHEKMKNGTPTGLADKSVPARKEKIELFFQKSKIDIWTYLFEKGLLGTTTFEIEFFWI